MVTKPTEETVTNGIIRVTRHGQEGRLLHRGLRRAAAIEAQQDPSGYAAAKLGLEQENYEVKTLLLPSAEKIPDDASVVALVGPERPLTERAIGAARRAT